MARRLPRIAVCLLLGLCTTVLVAWGLAVGVVVTIQGADAVVAEGAVPPWDPDEQWEWWCTVKRRPGLTVVVREPGREIVAMSGDLTERPTRILFRVPPRSTGGGLRASVSFLPTDAMPGWVEFDASAMAPPGGPIEAVSARGWPWRALWYRVDIRNNMRADLGGLPLPAKLRSLGPGYVLPYRPIVAGLLGDTALYAAAWYVLLMAPVTLVRHARRRAGRCVHCGYDLHAGAGDRCPECGSPGLISVPVPARTDDGSEEISPGLFASADR